MDKLREQEPGGYEAAIGRTPVAYRHWGSDLAGVAILVLASALVYAAARNPAFAWRVFAQYFFHRDVLAGLGLTIGLTLLVSVLGFALGTILALMRLSTNVVLRVASAGYTWFFRSVPVLVQLLFWYNIGFIVPTLSLSIPFGPHLTLDTHNLVSALGAAILGIGLSEAAHAGEIIRGGILSVDPGTIEAARALGLSPATIQAHIVIPQAVPAILPAAGNLVIGTLKGTSIVSIIAVSDLLYSVQLIYNDNYAIVPMLMVATVWYLIVTTVFSVAQASIERRFTNGRSGGAIGRIDRDVTMIGAAA